MSAYDVYQIFLANTTMLRMAPWGRRVRRKNDNKGMEKEELVGDGKRENKKIWLGYPKTNQQTDKK